MTAFLGGLDRADEEVGPDSVGDEGLRAVDQIAAVYPLRRGPQRGDIGAGSRLGDSEGADLLSPDAGTEPAFLLPLVAELENRGHGDRRMRVETGRDSTGSSAPGELLHPYGVMEVGAALAAVLLGELQTEEAELAAAVKQFARKEPGVLPFIDVGGDLVLDETADCFPQLGMLLTEGRGKLRFRHRGTP